MIPMKDRLAEEAAKHGIDLGEIGAKPTLTAPDREKLNFLRSVSALFTPPFLKKYFNINP
jgi:hypothetical protein